MYGKHDFAVVNIETGEINFTEVYLENLKNGLNLVPKPAVLPERYASVENELAEKRLSKEQKCLR